MIEVSHHKGERVEVYAVHVPWENGVWSQPEALRALVNKVFSAHPQGFIWTIHYTNDEAGWSYTALASAT